MLVLQNITYIHANKDVLFNNIHLTLNKHDKIALIGKNGIGKSTLLQLIAGIIQPLQGNIVRDSIPYYIPQIFGQFNEYTIAHALGIDDKLYALQQILDGDVSEANLEILADDWNIEERCKAALQYWKLEGLDFKQKMKTLSGGEKTKVFLAGIAIQNPDIVLMDEPSNHLDLESRKILYDFIQSTTQSLIVVSHDRVLLNILNTVCELDKYGISTYGGNYNFYTEQKKIERDALSLDIKSKEKSLRKAKEIERDTMERQQKLDARGRKKQEKAGLPTISMKTFKNNAEKSTARMKDIHSEKINDVSQALTRLRDELPDKDKMKFRFDQSGLHKGKILISVQGINMLYSGRDLWQQNLTLKISSGERIAVTGKNGCGKTTLIKILLGMLFPHTGIVTQAANETVYIDQEYSLINLRQTVYEQAMQYNTSALQEHEIKIRLDRFLFGKDAWGKVCNTLSGGEKMRLMLCCLTIRNQAPDVIVLDEPTNNLDIQNIEILTEAINGYSGTLVVISHDEHFLQQIGIERSIVL